MLVRNRTLLFAIMVAASQSGCGDGNAIRASFSNLERRGIVYAMNGSPISLPSAVAVRAGTAVGIDAGFNFDIAFDIDAAGKVLVYTQSRVATQLVQNHRVGLLVHDAPFDQLLRAPSGFVYDSLVTLPMGKTLVVDVFEASCGGTFLGPNVYAKITIDSIALPTRSIYLHMLTNPNCGFRSLVVGTPKD